GLKSVTHTQTNGRTNELTDRHYDFIRDSATALTFNHLVSPICLPNPLQSIPDDGQAVATGFGTTNDRGSNHTYKDGQLRETILPIVKSDICRQRYNRSDQEFYSHISGSFTQTICAGSIGHATGEGDSGGPLLMKASDGRWFQIGITSFGDDDDVSASGRPEGLVPSNL
ncbi:hypothetical protein PENTCL1PPCAC_29014, partial [Pristionchus entomophagus]